MLTAQGQRAHYSAVRARLAEPRVVVAIATPEIRIIKVRPTRAVVVKLYSHPIGPLRPSLHHLMLTCEPGSVAYAQKVLAEVCQKHQCRPLDVLSERQTRDLTVPRQEIMWRLRHETPWSFPRIGNFLGGRDHTTCLHGVKKHQAKLDAVKP